MNNISYEIINYGIFDSAVKFPGAVSTKERRLKFFEIELFTSDCPGTAYINGVPHRLVKGLLICGKPRQLRHSRLHFKCCCLHIKTNDTRLSELLYSLSDAMLIADYDELAELFYKAAAHPNKNPCDTLLLQSIIDRILYGILRFSENRGSALCDTSAHADTLRSIREYIKSSYPEKLSLEILAKRANLSPVYFHRLFSEYYNITPARYILNIRISAAKRQLIASGKTVMEIAADCGFSSQAYFNYIFKKNTGITPLKYRQKMLSKIEL